MAPVYLSSSQILKLLVYDQGLFRLIISMQTFRADFESLLPSFPKFPSGYGALTGLVPTETQNSMAPVWLATWRRPVIGPLLDAEIKIIVWPPPSTRRS